MYTHICTIYAHMHIHVYTTIHRRDIIFKTCFYHHTNTSLWHNVMIIHGVYCICIVLSQERLETKRTEYAFVTDETSYLFSVHFGYCLTCVTGNEKTRSNTTCLHETYATIHASTNFEIAISALFMGILTINDSCRTFIHKWITGELWIETW